MKAIAARLIAYNLSALALARPDPLSLRLSLVLLVLDAFGLTLVGLLAHAPLWVIGAVILVITAARFMPFLREYFSPALLAPFWIAYLVVALRVLWLRAFGGTIEGYFDYTLPDLRVLLQFEFFVSAAVLYSALIFLTLALRSRSKAVLFASIFCAGASIVWATAEYFGHRTFGATASDPFAYVQMGVDLVARGTPAHEFPLFPLIASTKIPWYPVLHVGYRLPYNLSGDAISVWSFGGSLAYALAYRAAGEFALYLVNPLFSLLAVFASGLLARELTRRESRAVRAAVTCLTVLLTATANEIVNWAGVTMVDAQALVFSALALYCALRVYRTCKWTWAVGAGVFWGLAYLVRHTQLVIAFAFVPLFMLAPFPWRTRVRNVLLVGITALVTALPDLWYHQIALGSWLTPESEELALFSREAVPQTTAAIFSSAFSGSEFGWVLLFIIFGSLFLLRRDKISSSALLSWLAAELAIHLPYAALRLRDLVPEFPVFAFYASYGTVATITWLVSRKRAWASVAAALVILLALELNLVRVWNTVPRVFSEPPARFGAMTQAQRASFDEIARLVPPNAIVGASLNSGAIALYAHRRAFRPADWCIERQCDELRAFTQIARENNYEIYFLEDNASLENVLNSLRAQYQVERVATLDIPLFGDEQITDAGVLWKISK